MAATVSLKVSITMTYIMLNIKVISSVVSPRYQMSALTLDLYSILLGLVVLGLVLAWLFRIPTSEAESVTF